MRETAAMAYDEELADRVRARVEREQGLTEKKMFGGLAFLINGHMAVSASSRGGLLLRVDPAETEKLLQEPNTGPFEMRGREMVGWLHLDASGLSEAELDLWVARGVSYAKSLPVK
jgi:TfoX/Sxy family transcriptional regulator of competence genes